MHQLQHAHDIFIAVESKLDPGVNDSEIIPPNFSISRRDRTGNGGRVFIAVKDNIVVESQPQFDTVCEIRWMKVHLEATKTLLVGAYYRPPKSSTTSLLELSKSKAMVSEKFPRAVLMLAGDFNLHGTDWTTLAHTPTKPDKQDCELLLSIAMEHNMEQLNLSPTRKKNILELVLTTSPDSVNSCDTGPGISDHDHIVITRCSLRPKQNKKKARTIRLFKKADWENIKPFLNDAEDTFFASSPEGNSVDNNWEYFKSVLIDAMKKFVPSKETSCRYDLTWITRHVKRLIRQTQWAYDRAKKSAKDRDWAKFRRKRKNCQKAQKEAHWNYLKGLRRDTCGVSTIAADGRTGTDPKDKAEMLNAQFSSVFTREDPFNVPTMTTSPHPKMPPIRVGSQGVLKLLQQLNTRKASGGDDIPAILLKNCALELCSMLTFIY